MCTGVVVDVSRGARGLRYWPEGVMRLPPPFVEQITCASVSLCMNTGLCARRDAPAYGELMLVFVFSFAVLIQLLVTRELLSNIWVCRKFPQLIIERAPKFEVLARSFPRPKINSSQSPPPPPWRRSTWHLPREVAIMDVLELTRKLENPRRFAVVPAMAMSTKEAAHPRRAVAPIATNVRYARNR